jgi:hypothetical protein
MTQTTRWLSIACVVALLIVSAGPARAELGDDELDFRVFPGASRAISHAMSASRDTALLGWQMSPYTSLTAGGDLSLVSFGFSGLTLRVGFFGMLELESARPYDADVDGWNGVLPMAGVDLWRGVIGFSTGVSLDELAKRWLGPRGRLEAVLSYRHESEHFTGPGDGDGKYEDIPIIGDFLMPDFAARFPLGPVDLEVRLQFKCFLPAGGFRQYIFGPGIDLIARWQLTDWIQPFVSVFGEYLWGNAEPYEGRTVDIPDNYQVRGLLGVVFPGRLGDVQLFTSLAVGHGKGLLVFREEFLWGWGIRLAFF